MSRSSLDTSLFFVGDFTLDAAEAVCNGIGQLTMAILDGVTSLVDKNLLRQVEGNEPRLVMLETIREYAAERLRDVPESEAAARAAQFPLLRLPAVLHRPA